MTLTVLLGFSVIGGILVGYLVARLRGRRVMMMIWAACAIALLLSVMWLEGGTGQASLDPIVILYGILIPFCASLFVASLIGAVVRMVLRDKTAP